MKTINDVFRYAKHLILIDFAVAFAGAYFGVWAYFWSATVHCGH